MYICLNCGNSTDFELQLWVPVKTDSMSQKITASVVVDMKTYDPSIRCGKCSRNGVWNLNLTTPRQMLTEISRRYMKEIKCPVQAARQAREWFADHAPHLVSWIDDEITGDIMVASDTFYNIPESEALMPDTDIQPFFTMQEEALEHAV